MAKGKKGSVKAKILTSLGVIIVAITTLWGYNHYMAEQKLNNLYKHGFRLLEEQIATYIVENYSGVSKVEFSPIFVDGDGRYTMRSVDVVPVIYDNHGNRALLGRRVNGHGYGSYGTSNGLILDIDNDGSNIIELEDFDTGKIVDVSAHSHLPVEAKLTSNVRTDKNISALIKDKQLEGVQKNEAGSPKAKIIYNLEVKRGEYLKWR